MPGPLFYLPGLSGSIDDRLRSAGLGCLVDPQDNRPGLEFKEILGTDKQPSPDGRPGVLVALASAQRFLPLYQHQAWLWQRIDCKLQIAKCKVQNDGCYYVGRLAGEPVLPADLARPKQYDSELVELADGHEWRMPIARRLPHAHRLLEGKFVRRVKAPYEDYYSEAERFLQIFLEHDTAQADVPIDAGDWFAVRGLSLNYCLSAELIDWLGLLDDANFLYLIGASFEFGSFARALAQKKTAAASPSPVS